MRNIMIMMVVIMMVSCGGGSGGSGPGLSSVIGNTTMTIIDDDGEQSEVLFLKDHRVVLRETDDDGVVDWSGTWSEINGKIDVKFNVYTTYDANDWYTELLSHVELYEATLEFPEGYASGKRYNGTFTVMFTVPYSEHSGSETISGTIIEIMPVTL